MTYDGRKAHRITRAVPINVFVDRTDVAYIFPQLSHVSWSVCMSVCVYAGHTNELCKNDRTDRDAIWGRGWAD